MSDMELFEEEEKPLAQDFKVDSLEKADWAMRKIGRAEAEIDRFTELAKDMKARIDARLALITGHHQKTIEAMSYLLRPWAEVEIARSGKARSFKLISGVVGFRQSPERLEVEDADSVISWLESNHREDCIRLKKEVDKTQVKDLIKETGQLPDGCSLKQGDITFFAKPEPPMLEKK